MGGLSPCDSSIIFLPFLYGTNVNADAKARFIGIDGPQSKQHMIREIYEGGVFSHMTHIDRLFQSLDKPQAVRISGGATESKEWVQIFADVQYQCRLCIKKWDCGNEYTWAQRGCRGSYTIGMMIAEVRNIAKGHMALKNGQ